MIHTIIQNIEVYFSEKKQGDCRGKALVNNLCKNNKIFQDKKIAYSAVSHGSRIEEVTQDNYSESFSCDALISCDSGIAVSISVADCLPIVICDSVSGFFALVHGGWRSLLQNIVPLTIKESMLRFEASPEDMYVWIGPSIRSCCNIAQTAEIHQSFPEWRPFIEEKHDGMHIDLQKAVQYQCQNQGILQENILDSGSCTFHQEQDFFSYRRAMLHNDPLEDKRHMCIVGMQ